MKRPRIVVDIAPELAADLFDAELLARLNAAGEVRVTGGSGDGREWGEILVTGWGTPPLEPHRSKRSPDLVVHSAGTIRKLVPKSLIEEGVQVTQAPQGTATSVAELALYLTTGLLRDLHSVDRVMFEHRDWGAASRLGLGRTVDGTRITVVGASRVGRLYIRKAGALGALLTVYDPYLSEADAEELGVVISRDLDEALSGAEVVALHAPVTDETVRMLSGERLAKLPAGTLIVNTARSALIDMPALERELVNGRLSAALDVFDIEPLPAGSPLWGLPNVILTPHLGAVTINSRRAQGRIVVEEIERYVAGEPLHNAISAGVYDRLA
jgi:phosphoglycerate dehydrogenase-like enzyme